MSDVYTAMCIADVKDITAKVTAWVAEPAQRDVTGFAVELMPSSYEVNDWLANPARVVNVSLSFSEWRSIRTFSLMAIRSGLGDDVIWILEEMAKEAREKIKKRPKVLPLPK